MTGIKQEGAVNFPEGKETSLDVTFKQLSREVKQEEDGTACMIGKGSFLGELQLPAVFALSHVTFMPSILFIAEFHH